MDNGAGYITSTLTNEQVQDIVGGMVSGNTETNITVTYDDNNGKLNFSASGGGGISNVVEDTTPQLGGNLDLNSKDITGTGGINILGVGTFSSLDPISVTIKNSRFLYFGNSNEGIITYDAANLEIATSSGDLNLKGSGSVALYESSSKKLETSTSGISVTGALTASGNVTAYSDINLKKDIQPIENALDKVMKINGVTYGRTDFETETRYAGVIAQEVEKVLPEVVVEDENGTKSVAYGNMIALLIEAVKEQQQEINILKEKINNATS